MATRQLRIIVGGAPKTINSSAETLDFLSVKVGASGLEIKETSSHFDFSAKRLTNVATPSSASDAATKGYADSIAAGFDPKDSVDAATTAALPTVTAAGSGVGKTLTATANGALSIDSYSPSAGERVLVKDQVAGLNNGIYLVTDAGSAGTPFILTRATDFDGNPSGEVSKGAITLAVNGTVNGGYQWYLTTAGTITVDTTALSFSKASIALSQVDDSITDGVTDRAPSQNAVFDALALKASISYADGKVADAINDGTTNIAPSQNAVFDALALKLDDVADNRTNDNAGSITQGQLVYLKSTGAVDLARANASGTATGLLLYVTAATIATTASGAMKRRPGNLVTVPGATFTVGSVLYLSTATDGAVTHTAPTTAGHIRRPVGVALSATTFEWNVEEAEEILS